MTTKILTNKVSVDINYSQLLAKYSIFKITNKANTQEEYKKFYHTIRTELNPLASARSGKYTLVAYSVNKDAPTNLKYEIKKLMFSELKREKEYVLLNLINSLLPNESLYFGLENDPYGTFYLVKSTKSKLVALKLYVDKNMLVSLRVVTFIKSTRTKDKEIYALRENRIIRVLERKKDEIYYIKGNYSNSKSTYLFMGFQLNYKDSKVYVLAKYIEEIERYFGDIVTLEFLESDMVLFDNAKDIKSRKSELKEKIISFVKSKKKIHIANYSGIDLDESIEKLKSLLVDYVGDDIAISTSNKTSTTGLNLTITRNKEYYIKNKLDDPYKIIKQLNKATQNLTLETLREIISSKDTLIHVLLKEVVIKKEIEDRQITLPYKKNPDGFTFICPKKDKNGHVFYKVSFIQKKMIFADLTSSEKRVCDEIVMTSSSAVETIIFDKNNNVGYILRTESFVLPRFKEINNLLYDYEKPIYLKSDKVLSLWSDVYGDSKKEKEKELIESLSSIKDIYSGNIDVLKLNINGVQKFKNIISKTVGSKITFNLRRYEYREFIESLVGIQYKECEEHAKYIVGSEKNLGKTLEKSTLIRELHYYKGKIPINDILGMLSEYFVKNGSFTVLPFPIKYIREYYYI